MFDTDLPREKHVLPRLGPSDFKTRKEIFRRVPEPGRRTAPPLIELAELAAATRAFETNMETAADLAYLRGRGTSLGGLRPKCTVVDEKGHLSIGKFPSVADERAVTKGEVLAMRLARVAGIQTAEARLLDSDGVSVALIKRFDRSDGGRLLYVSAATMLGAEPSDSGNHSEYVPELDAEWRVKPLQEIAKARRSRDERHRGRRWTRRKDTKRSHLRCGRNRWADDVRCGAPNAGLCDRCLRPGATQRENREKDPERYRPCHRDSSHLVSPARRCVPSRGSRYRA